jgi:acetoin utilization deacetylase AcuC-like enzyme
VLRYALNEVIEPAVERHGATWLLVSAGFDGHRADPLTDLGYTSTDYEEAVAELLTLVPPGRRLLFLEGGYDLDALRRCAAAVTGASLGVSIRPEPTSSGGPGIEMVDVVHSLHFRR